MIDDVISAVLFPGVPLGLLMKSLPRGWLCFDAKNIDDYKKDLQCSIAPCVCFWRTLYSVGRELIWCAGQQKHLSVDSPRYLLFSMLLFVLVACMSLPPGK
jgi:hypothetical protein